MEGNTRRYRWAVQLLAVLLAGVLLAAATSSLAQEGSPNWGAQEAGLAGEGGVDGLDLDADLDAVMGKVILIPPSAFVPDGVSSDKYVMDFDGGYVRGWNGGAYMLAPVMLPEGASRILTVYVYAHDDNPYDESSVCLRRTLLSVGKTGVMGCVYTSDSTEVEAYRIDYTMAWQYLSNNRAYQLTMWLPEGVYIYGMKVLYK